MAPANAEFDLSGTWNWIGDGTSQPIQVVQAGTDLSIDLGFGDGPLTGTIDKMTGDFTVIGSLCSYCVGVAVVGTASPDGNSMSGKFQAGGSISSPFNAVRKSATTPTPPLPVGGIAIDPDIGALPLRSGDRPGLGVGVVPLAAVFTAIVVLSGAAWYARKRLQS